jgi:hypothetical protein
MNRISLLLVLAVCGCSKTNDIPVLEEDATAIIHFYQPKREAILRRMHEVIAQSSRIPKNLPGSDEATRALADANARLDAMQKLQAQVEKQAPALANEGKREQLGRLVADEEKQFAEGVADANENLSQAESWLANAIRTNAVPGAPAPAPVPAEPTDIVPPNAIP